MAYEISKTFAHKKITVNTPLDVAEVNVPDEEVVIAAILRADPISP